MSDVDRENKDSFVLKIAETTVNPYVFISHDGRDSELAEAFSKL